MREWACAGAGGCTTASLWARARARVRCAGAGRQRRGCKCGCRCGCGAESCRGRDGAKDTDTGTGVVEDGGWILCRSWGRMSWKDVCACAVKLGRLWVQSACTRAKVNLSSQRVLPGRSRSLAHAYSLRPLLSRAPRLHHPLCEHLRVPDPRERRCAPQRRQVPAPAALKERQR
jgi:hypothetical protein